MGQLEQLLLNLAFLDAAREADKNALVAALEKGAQPTAKDGLGATGLVLAALAGSDECLRILLPISDVNACCRKGWTALMHAVQQGDVRCVHTLIEEAGGLLDARCSNREGESALSLAAKNGCQQCVRELLPLSDSKLKNTEGRTALMHAARVAPNCVNDLIPHSNVKDCDNRGWTALMHAAFCGQEDSVSLLLPYSDVHYRNRKKANALNCAKGGDQPKVESLIRSFLRAQEEWNVLDECVPWAESLKNQGVESL